MQLANVLLTTSIDMLWPQLAEEVAFCSHYAEARIMAAGCKLIGIRCRVEMFQTLSHIPRHCLSKHHISEAISYFDKAHEFMEGPDQIA